MDRKQSDVMMHKESGEEGNIVQQLIATTARIEMDQDE